MKQSRILLVAVALCVAGFGNVFAATWNGSYIGATAGVGKSKVSFSAGPTATGTYFATTSVPTINASGSGSANDSGATTGLTLGYNAQSGMFVYGGEFDADYLRNKISRSNTAIYPCCVTSSYTLNQFAKIDGLVTLRGRAGVGVGNSLIYGTGGMALTSLKTGYDFNDNFGLNAQTGSTQTQPKLGWVLGLGYEYALPGNLSVKAEYLHVDFGDVSQNSTMTAIGSSAPFASSVQVHTNVIRLGVNMKF